MPNESLSYSKGPKMTEPTQDSPEEFAPTREHEFQDSHYHDEEPDIAIDEGDGFHASHAPPDKKKPTRRPPPKRWFYEE
jgi:hypothetical protein